jgi:hypothetical protein
MIVHLRIKLRWQLNNCIELFFCSCEFNHQMQFHSLCRRWLITEETQVVLFSYLPSSTRTMKVQHRIKLTWQLNNYIQSFISSCEFDPVMHFLFFVSKSPDNWRDANRSIQLLAPFDINNQNCMWGSNSHEEMNNCIQLFRCHVSLILRCTFIVSVEEG